MFDHFVGLALKGVTPNNQKPRLNKAHGPAMFSIRMFKLCGDLISKPLETSWKRVYKIVDSCWNGEKPMLSLSIRKVTKYQKL